MHKKGGSLVRRWTRFLAVVGMLVTVIGSVPPAKRDAAAAPLPDGIWRVQGRAIHGTRCGDWLVTLTNRQGRLSGVVALARASVPIEGLVLQPDGSFAGTTRAGLVGSRHARAYRVSGRFSGDTVTLTLEGNLCPPRHGTAIRQAAVG
jgi:hypothetical protein